MFDPIQIGIMVGCATAGVALGWFVARRIGQSRLRQLEAQTRTDPLTGLWNRQALDEQLVIQASIARRYKSRLTVVVVDIDHFKEINDRLGHAAGDAALRQIAQLIRSCCRDSDCVGRLGGDEFVIILPQTDSAGGRILAERIRVRAGLDVTSGESRLRVSLGVASLLADESALSLLQRADQALYRAKQNGRDQTCVHDG